LRYPKSKTCRCRKHQTEPAHCGESQALKHRPVTLVVIRKNSEKQNEPSDAAEPRHLTGQQHQTEASRDHRGEQSYGINSGIRHFIFSMRERALATLRAS
jgi:hypothetical protein